MPRDSVGGGDRRNRRRKHLIAVQQCVLALMAESDPQDPLIPLGVELSWVGSHVSRVLHQRADALLSTSSGCRVVFLEVLRKRERDLSVEHRRKYEWLRRDLRVLAAVLETPVELYLQHPHGEVERALYEPGTLAGAPGTDEGEPLAPDDWALDEFE